MKKIIFCLLIAACIVSMGSCNKGGTKEKALQEFAFHFGEMAQKNDIQGIKDVYPDAGNITAAHLDFNKDKIEIFPEGEGKFRIKYGSGAYIIVRTGLRNAIEVIDSEGIFDGKGSADKKDEQAESEAPKKSEVKEEKRESKPKEPVNYYNSMFADGFNQLSGSFHFQGADYGFVVNFYFDKATGRVSNAVYEATGYSSGSTNKINSMTIGANDSSISISGPGLKIKASKRGSGTFSGSMTRGKHSGTCTMYY